MNLDESLTKIEYLRNNPDSYKGKGFIYLLECKDEKVTEKYIGSGISEENIKKVFIQALKSDHSQYNNRPVFKCIRNNGGLDNWTFKPIDIYEEEYTPRYINYLKIKYIKLFNTSLNCGPELKRAKK